MTTNINFLAEYYHTKVTVQLQKQLGKKNPLAVPRPIKLTINVGLGRAKEDERLTQVAWQTLQKISGQKPVLTKARQSISAFKIREGMNVGAMVTLRGRKMWDLLEKIIKVVLPRVRDFRGISRKSIDQRGNLTLGFREHLVFPEITADDADKIHGLEVTIITTAKNKDEAYDLLKSFNFPFND